METVQFQSFVFSYSVYGGILIGIIYDIYGVFRGRKRNDKLITSFWDIMFIISVFLIIVWAIFSSNYGDIRAYVLIGFVVGFYLYERLLGRIAAALLQFIIRRLVYFVKTTNNMAAMPLRIVFSLGRRGMERLAVFLGKKKKRLKNVSKLPKLIIEDTKKHYRLVVKSQKKISKM